ncbi:hypothetical protein FRC06_006047 [Ceratobasidium sp. 370]|nr:hypothetical protein FRC06_006047 [Ceratobasidium sp. 370]
MVEHPTVQTTPNGTQSLSNDVAIIVLFGATGAGKTSFANTASGGDCLTVGHGVKSCTEEVEKTEVFMIDGRPVVLVDCPGFDDTILSDAEILKRIAEFLASIYSNKTNITGLLYLHRITDIRFGGAGRRNFRMFRKMCGTDSLKNVVVVTSMWSQPPTEKELAREAELRDGDDFFQDILSEGAQMVRHSEPTRESAYNVIRCVLSKGTVVPDLSRQIVDQGIKLEDTDAGHALREELAEVARKQQEELKRLEAERIEAARQEEERRIQELARQEEQARARQQELERRLEAERQAQAAQEAARRAQAEQAEAAHRARVAEMQRVHNEQIAAIAREAEHRRHDNGPCIIA